MSSTLRPLSPEDLGPIEAARRCAELLYEGRVTPHRSCGIALAETFGLATPPYQALRKGGLSGRGECGTAVAGRLVLGQLLGDPDPTGAVTPRLAEAMEAYDTLWPERTGAASGAACDTLVSPLGDFRGPARARFCTNLAAETAALVAELLLRAGHLFPPPPVPEDP